MMTVQRSVTAVLFLVSALCLQTRAQLPTCGGEVMISEWHHPGQTLPASTVNPVSVPYLEIMSRSQNGQPTDVSGLVINILWTDLLGVLQQRSLTLAQGTFIPEATAGGASPGVLVIAPAPSQIPVPVPISPLGHPYLYTPAPGLFAPALGQGAPGTPTRIRMLVQGPTPGQQNISELIMGSDPGGTPATVFSGPIPPATGHINRATYIHNCQGYNYEASVGLNSPGVPNPVLDHVGGFRFSQTSFTLNSVAGGGVSGSFNFPAVGPRVQSILFPRHPDHPVISDPLFDRTLRPTATLQISSAAAITASSNFLGNVALPGGMAWTLSVPPSTAGGQNGVLGILMAAMSEVPGTATFNITSPTQATPLRVERLLTDNQVTDASITILGDGSEVQIDVSNTSGDVWCDLIVYDGGGNAYEAKVRNWPSNPVNCNTPNLGIGTPGGGQVNVIAICFNPQAELYILPSLNPSVPTGSGSFAGINMDLATLLALGAPLSSHPLPFHVNANNDGLYFTTFNVAPITPLTADWVALEYDSVSGSFVSASPVVSATIN